jgi:hypothetical protein
MRSTGPQWVALVLAALALAIITYISVPPTVIKQATALWGGGCAEFKMSGSRLWYGSRLA